VYGAQTKQVFTVTIAIAPDEATAKSEEAAAEQDLKAKAAENAAIGPVVTELPNFAPNSDAVMMGAEKTLAGYTIGARAIYVLRGATFLGFSDVAIDAKVPTADAVKAEAMTVPGRVP
jgi:hypothetical protein